MSDYISGDSIALLILRWLPVKTLLQFRCVCKGWKEIIDSPFFIQDHLSLQKPRFLLQNEGSAECFVVDPHALPSLNVLNGPIEDKKLLFCGTHHGVVCLYEEFTSSKLLLWNPSIRKLLSVPIPPWQWSYIEGLSWFGFWIDPCTKEYKFLLLNSIMDDKEEYVGVECVLYSSIRQDWRLIPPPEVGYWVPCPPVMLQGVAHWGGYKSENNARIILSFDFVLERFDLIEMPDPNLSYDFVRTIHCHWQGNLSLVVRARGFSGKYNMYLRQEGLWVNMPGFNFIPQIYNVFWVLGEKGRVRVLSGNGGELVLYDTRDGIIHLTDDRLTDDRSYVYDNAFVAYDFVESFLFP